MKHNVFNPEGIEPGDTVRIANPREDDDPLGDMLVETVGGKNGNKVYCKEIGHELYANCFKLVAKRGSAEQTGFGVPAQTPKQAGKATAARRQAVRMKWARIYIEGAVGALESACNSTGGKFAHANDLNIAINKLYADASDLLGDLDCQDYDATGKRTAH